MNHVLAPLLTKYKPASAGEWTDALREIIQQITLLGLWRAKFYDHAAFYGGTALRIFYGIPRFSEDLDFSLTAPDAGFDITPFLDAIQTELESFGFSVVATRKAKTLPTAIESAFIKANTLRNFLAIDAPEGLIKSTHRNQNLTLRLEVDSDPPALAEFETKMALVPIPHQVRLYSLECLFAGKVHAVLCREWGKRVKGRDYFDFVWFLGQGTGCHLKHLSARMVQTGHLAKGTTLDRTRLIDLLKEKFSRVNFNDAKSDMKPFIMDSRSLDLWSESFFSKLAEQIKTV